MRIEACAFLLGALFLLIGILGGGVEVEKFKIPRMGVVTRAIVTVFGFVFMGLGLAMVSQESLVELLTSDVREQEASGTAPAEPASPDEEAALTFMETETAPVATPAARKPGRAEPKAEDMVDEIKVMSAAEPVTGQTPVQVQSVEEPGHLTAAAERPVQVEESIQFIIYSLLGDAQISQSVVIRLEGELAGMVVVDEHNPRSSIVAALPCGPRQYTLKAQGCFFDYEDYVEFEHFGFGQGTIDVEPGKTFRVECTYIDTVWRLALVEHED